MDRLCACVGCYGCDDWKVLLPYEMFINGTIFNDLPGDTFMSILRLYGIE